MDLFFLFGCGNRGDFRLVGEDLALHIFIVRAGREILCKPGSGFLCMETKGLEQIRGGMGIDSAGGSIASDACAGILSSSGRSSSCSARLQKLRRGGEKVAQSAEP